MMHMLTAQICSLEAAAKLGAISRQSIVFIRHGESEYNATPLFSRLFEMHRDAPLSTRGIEEAQRAAEEIRGRMLADAVIVSPLRRADQFARIIFDRSTEDLEISPLHSEWQVAPVDVPVVGFKKHKRTLSGLLHNIRVATSVGWRGVSRQQMFFRIVRFIQAVEMWRIGARVETRDELKDRVRSFIEYILKHEPGRIVVVGHGRFFAQMLNGKHLENGEVAILSRGELERLLNTCEVLP